MDFCMILSTAADQEQADKITAALLNAKVASCVQQIPITSQYQWKGEVAKSEEILLQIKSRDDLYSRVEEIIKQNHSYEIPQIIKTPITGGLPEYLDWIKSETE